MCYVYLSYVIGLAAFIFYLGYVWTTLQKLQKLAVFFIVNR